MSANVGSLKKDLIAFDNAIECMNPFEVKDYLGKTLNFLNGNNTECFFPSISPHIEAFLVGLVSDTRNLKSNQFKHENKKIALDIIEALELHRDVFRWTYAYEKGKLIKNLLVYKKIFTTRMKMKPTELRKPASSISQRLIQQTEEQSEIVDIPTGCKIQLLNTTIRFLKNDERSLHYPDMPTAHAQFMCTLINNPKNDLNVGFGFKSLYAPLFEAMKVCGMCYELRIWFDVAEKNGPDAVSLKLQKIPKKEHPGKENCLERKPRNEPLENNQGKETSQEKNQREEPNNSLNTSLSSSSSSRSRGRRRRPPEAWRGAGAAFRARALDELLAFTADPARARFTLQGLSDDETAFIKAVKTLAGSTSSHSSLDSSLRASLQQLHANITEVMKTCTIRIEEGKTRSKIRYITLKKVPREEDPVKPSGVVKPPLRSKSVAGARSTSTDSLIQFQSAGKLNPTGATDKLAQPAESAQRSVISKDILNKRQVKLLEAMSIPVDSDKGKRMMERMGWAGGALGARAGGLLEPLLPAIELPSGAGLGHVPPPRATPRSAEDFRPALLRDLRDLLLQPAATKLVEYKLPLSKKERNFLNATVTSLNKGKTLGLGVRAEQELGQVLLQTMLRARDLDLRAEVSQDLRKVTLIKYNSAKQRLPMKLQLGKLQDDQDLPETMTVLNTRAEYEVINEDMIKQVIASSDTISQTAGRTPAAIRSKALRVLFLQRFNDFVRGRGEAREFRFKGTLQKKMMALLERVVANVNRRAICPQGAEEEVGLYVDLLQTARDRGCYLDILFDTPSNFVLRKITDKTAQYQNGLTNSTCAQPSRDDNNNQHTNDKSRIKTTNEKADSKPSADDDTPNGVITKENPKEVNFAGTFSTLANKATGHNNIVKDKELSGSLKSEETGPDTKCLSLKLKDISEIQGGSYTEHVRRLMRNENGDTKMETKPDVNQPNGLVQKKYLKFREDSKMITETEIKHGHGLLQKDDLKDKDVTKMTIKSDIEHKDNPLLNGATIAKDAAELNDIQEDKTDNGIDSSWSTCSDNEIDISELDKDIEDLDQALCEVGLGFNVNRANDNDVSPKSNDSRTNSLNPHELRIKVIKKNNIVVIAPKNPVKKMNADLIKETQSLILKKIDEEEFAIPLLKCHGAQNAGLVYSCHDEKDAAWLKKVISVANLDLKVTDGADDCIEERKSRKMAVKINSFITLDTREVFSKIEMYNGIGTKHWKVLFYQTYSNFVLLVVEVDETSFEYISENNFSLYMGIDKAVFSIIF